MAELVMAATGTGRYAITMKRAEKRPESSRPQGPQVEPWSPDTDLVWWWLIRDPAGDRHSVGWEYSQDTSYEEAQKKMREIRSMNAANR